MRSLEFSTTSIEALVRDALRHDLNALLDTTLLGAGAATSARPAGLWNCRNRSDAVSGHAEVRRHDGGSAGLAGGGRTNAPDAQVVFVVNPKQALPVLGMTQQNARGFQLIVSGYQTVGSVGCGRCERLRLDALRLAVPVVIRCDGARRHGAGGDRHCRHAATRLGADDQSVPGRSDRFAVRTLVGVVGAAAFRRDGAGDLP